MHRIAKLDSLDLGWFILFMLVAAPVFLLAMLIVGGNPLAIGVLLGLLLTAGWLLLAGISKWQEWLLRLVLTASITVTWFLLSAVVWGYFRDFC